MNAIIPTTNVIRALAIAVSLISFAVIGCGGSRSAKVTGNVKCQGKAITGSITFSPFGESKENTGAAVSAPLKPDGSYELTLKTIGKHRVVVSPDDVKYPVKEGEEMHRCDLSPQEFDLKEGDNTILIELPDRKR